MSSQKKIFAVKSVTYVVTFIVGVTGGYYLYLGLNYSVEALATGAVVLAFLTWLGSGTDLLQFFLNLIEKYRADARKAEEDIEFKKKEHYERDIRNSIFHPWLMIKNQVTGKLVGYNDISFMLYLDVKSYLLSIDRFGEAGKHLESGYKNDSIFTIYNEIINQENTHNSKVSTVIFELESKIKQDIAQNTSLIAFDKRISQRPPYYYYDIIIEYFGRLVEEKSIVMEVSPWDEFPELRLIVTGYPHSVQKTESQIAIGSESDLQWLKHYLADLSVHAKIISTYYGDIDTMNNLLQTFVDEIKKVIHQADRSGFKGKCEYEESLEKK